MDRVQYLGVEQVMTPAPACLEQDCTLAGALAFLVREHYQAAPIVAPDGQLVGVLTRANLLAWLSKRVETERADTSLDELLGTAIGPAIDRTPLRCSAGMRLKDASKILVREHAPAMLVVRDGRLLGILTLRDIVRAMAFGDEPVSLDHVGHGRGGCFSPTGLPERTGRLEEQDPVPERLRSHRSL